MKITLDRMALKRLIDEDPDFELELKAAVVSEVGRRFFEKDAARVIAAASPELFAKALASLQEQKDVHALVNDALKSSVMTKAGYGYGVKVAPEVRAHVDKMVADEKLKLEIEASSKITEVYNHAIRQAVEKRIARDDLDEAIEKRVNRLVEQEINRRVDEKLAQRLADLRSALGG